MSDPICIQRGIYQGNSLRQLWFCLALNPLSYLLNRTNYGFGIHSGNQEMQRLKHLLYMGNIKLYAAPNNQLQELLELTTGQILAAVGPEYREFSNVWVSLDNKVRTTDSLLDKLCAFERRLQTLTTVAESSTFVAHTSTTKSQSMTMTTRVSQLVEEVNRRQQRKPQLFSLWEGWPPEKELSETES